MADILVQVEGADSPLPAGKAAGGVRVEVTDGAGALQTASLNGSESPPYSARFTVEPGDGTVVATAVDGDGNPLAPAVSAGFHVDPVATFFAPSGVTVTPA